MAVKRDPEAPRLSRKASWLAHGKRAGRKAPGGAGREGEVAKGKAGASTLGILGSLVHDRSSGQAGLALWPVVSLEVILAVQRTGSCSAPEVHRIPILKATRSARPRRRAAELQTPCTQSEPGPAYSPSCAQSFWARLYPYRSPLAWLRLQPEPSLGRT
ncbi:hypothetical protein J1605_003852 [Eschrichtius robustus]|uniref:Uncharacterized protein n=1 Tax=Eschrichtius robustus TaxID=9764 RepID=A0AB34HLD8_ESCRO|nr:hypothetical protein J1605_003852 [Eschrichtius robustus]